MLQYERWDIPRLAHGARPTGTEHEQNRQGNDPSSLAVPDCCDGAIFRPVAAYGALLLLSAHTLLGLLFRTPARDAHCLCLRVPRCLIGLPEQPDAYTPCALPTRGADI